MRDLSASTWQGDSDLSPWSPCLIIPWDCHADDISSIYSNWQDLLMCVILACLIEHITTSFLLLQKWHNLDHQATSKKSHNLHEQNNHWVSLVLIDRLVCPIVAWSLVSDEKWESDTPLEKIGLGQWWDQNATIDWATVCKKQWHSTSHYA